MRCGAPRRRDASLVLFGHFEATLSTHDGYVIVGALHGVEILVVFLEIIDPLPSTPPSSSSAAPPSAAMPRPSFSPSSLRSLDTPSSPFGASSAAGVASAGHAAAASSTCDGVLLQVVEHREQTGDTHFDTHGYRARFRRRSSVSTRSS